jgi:hypothetical protein
VATDGPDSLPGSTGGRQEIVINRGYSNMPKNNYPSVCLSCAFSVPFTTRNCKLVLDPFDINGVSLADGKLLLNAVALLTLVSVTQI